jgi:hypothetical protein
MEKNILQTVKRFGLDLGKLGFTDKSKLLEELGEGLTESTGPEAFAEPVSATFAEKTAEPDSSVAHILAGSIEAIQGFYFPAELLGGCCPRVVGEEENIVWNAAAEATDSERVHIVWQAQGDKVWYLAIRSSELASHPGTWCPFAAFLPGLKDAGQLPSCYTYYTDEAATMMTISSDGLQIHRGTASVLRVKAERTVRDSGKDVTMVELTPDIIEKLTPVPWYSVSLFEDRARRILAALSVFSSLAMAGLAVVVWFIASMAVVSAHADLSSIKENTVSKSMQLLDVVQTLRSSPMREQLGKFSDLNDSLLTLSGYMEIYQIKGGKVLWRAIIPGNVTSNRISEIGGQTLDTTPQGVVIGSGRDALTYKNK